MGDFFTDLADAAGAVLPGVGAVVSAIQTGDNNRESRELAVSQNAISRDFAREQSRFNANEAAIQREFQRDMANTAHQREMADLKAAGLNPILAANQGAASPVGASGSAVSAPQGGMPTLQNPRVGDAFDKLASSARAQAEFRKQLEATDANIQLSNASTAAKLTEADKNQSSAVGQRLQNKIMKTQLPKVAAEVEKDVGQAGWDKWFQGFDNWLRRAGDVGSTFSDLVNPISAVKRGLDVKMNKGVPFKTQSGRSGFKVGSKNYYEHNTKD